MLKEQLPCSKFINQPIPLKILQLEAH